MPNRRFSSRLTKPACLGFCAVATILTMSGCSLKDELGLTRRSPDEFAVVRRAPLEMPPDLRLPTPQPGAPRPQELSPADIAKASLLGGDPAARATTSASDAQADNALLQQLGATQAAPDIRTTVDAEATDDANSNRSAIDKLMGKKGESEGQVLDPLEENKRLQQLGKPAVNVPADFGKTPADNAVPSIGKDLASPPIQ